MPHSTLPNRCCPWVFTTHKLSTAEVPPAFAQNAAHSPQELSGPDRVLAPGISEMRFGLGWSLKTKWGKEKEVSPASSTVCELGWGAMVLSL